MSYSGQIARLQGLEGYAYVRNQKDGIDLFTAILKIIDTIPDKDGFNLTTSTSPTKYKKEKEIIVAGKSVIPAEKRPIADCYFDSATLRLPLMNKSIPLVKKNVILYK
ncbi:hypothetical protein [Microcoleus sp. PH2017_30_WIL_O_A]|uniref:hypothetical protein n=1 Tax=Microcoleus sp. PH2017_30_WIL_O_A TaxID=2798840 RepID=UPI001D62AC33|nr:hypothetical protein [Microcoleus sp. PH2017_30_WIL_O_A]MCC3588663.1 hypothetical protein [Microcoleus sp. PH2017_30_WIL_O_A]